MRKCKDFASPAFLSLSWQSHRKSQFLPFSKNQQSWMDKEGKTRMHVTNWHLATNPFSRAMNNIREPREKEQPLEQKKGKYESKNYIRHTIFGQLNKKWNICTASNWLNLLLNHLNSLRGRFTVTQCLYNSLNTGFACYKVRPLNPASDFGIIASPSPYLHFF